MRVGDYDNDGSTTNPVRPRITGKDRTLYHNQENGHFFSNGLTGLALPGVAGPIGQHLPGATVLRFFLPVDLTSAMGKLLPSGRPNTTFPFRLNKKTTVPKPGEGINVVS